MKLFLKDITETLARILQEKFQENFLARFYQQLVENYLANFSCKILTSFFKSWKKSFIFTVRLARDEQELTQHLASLARNILATFAYFLQDSFY